MGILKNGIFGSASGKIGKLVTYRLFDKNVVRMVGEINKPPTQGQLAGRLQMAVVIDFLKPINGFINAGFGVRAAEQHRVPHNLAVSYNKKGALTGVYPDIRMDYPKAVVAAGNLPAAENALAVLVPEGLMFTWDVGDGMDFPMRTHRTMLLAYFPLSGKAVFQIGGSTRISGGEILPLKGALRDEYMETYISFISLPGNEVADSVYTGRLNAQI